MTTAIKVTLRSVEYSARMSEETSCFDAIVQMNGVDRFRASNTGKGGMTDFNPLTAMGYDAMRAAVAELEAFAKTLPVEISHGFKHQPDAEGLVNDALHTWLVAKDFKRMSAKKLVLLDGGKVYTLTCKIPPAKIEGHEREEMIRRIGKNYPTAELLNYLPVDEAVQKFASVQS